MMSFMNDYLKVGLQHPNINKIQTLLFSPNPVQKRFIDITITMLLPLFFTYLSLLFQHTLIWSGTLLFSTVLYALIMTPPRGIYLYPPVIATGFIIFQITDGINSILFNNALTIHLFAYTTLIIIQFLLFIAAQNYHQKKDLDHTITYQDNIIKILMRSSGALSCHTKTDELYYQILQNLKPIFPNHHFALILSGPRENIIQHAALKQLSKIDQQKLLQSHILYSTKTPFTHKNGWQIFSAKITIRSINGHDDYYLKLFIQGTPLTSREQEILYLFFQQIKGMSGERLYTTELERYANIDPLTKVFNRHYFNSTLAHLNRHTTYNQEFTIFSCDIIGLKRINNHYGHPIGDQVIKESSELIKKQIRKSDQLFRVGGDEFVIVCPHTTLRDALIVYNRIKDAENKITVPCISPNNSTEIQESISIGIGFASSLEAAGIDILKLADQRMTENKDIWYQKNNV